MREPKKITALFAFVVAEPDGGEGVPAYTLPDGMVFPLMGADLERVESLRPLAQAVADLSGRSMRILKFSGLEQIGVVEPRRRKEPTQ